MKKIFINISSPPLGSPSYSPTENFAYLSWVNTWFDNGTATKVPISSRRYYA